MANIWLIEAEKDELLKDLLKLFRGKVFNSVDEGMDLYWKLYKEELNKHPILINGRQGVVKLHFDIKWIADKGKAWMWDIENHIL